jgi:hypothetical protein
MIEDKDQGFGRCGCGAWAVVKMNKTPRCLSCFQDGLIAVRRLADVLAASLSKPSPSDGGSRGA